MIRGRRPSIQQVGNVTTTDTETRISGWALGLCATQCSCHMNPLTGALVIAEDQQAGRLGLVCYKPGPPCSCCSPWTAAELTLVVSNLADIAALQGQPPAQPPADAAS